MSPAVDLVTKLATVGVPAELLAEVAERLFRGQDAEEAIAKRRKNERTRKSRSRDVTGQDVTSREVTVEGGMSHDVTQPLSPEVSPHTPLPKPLSPPAPKGATPHRKSSLPADWKPPAISELTEVARSLAQEWTPAEYRCAAEKFSCFWRGNGRPQLDWGQIWCKWVIEEHPKILHLRRYGGEYGVQSSDKITDPVVIARNKRSLANLRDHMGQSAEAAALRQEAEQLERSVAAGDRAEPN